MASLRSTVLSTSLAAFGLFAAAPAIAATYGYELSINDPIFNSTSGDFNVPDLQLENISDSGSGIGITDFSLTIGDTTFNFDFVRMQNAFNDPGSDLTFTLNTVGTANDSVGEDILDYDFTGFDAGDIFRSEVDVDPDTGTPVQDFRLVLFPDAVASVTFSNGETLSQVLDPSDTSVTGYTFEQTATDAPLPVPLPASMPLLLGAGVILAGAARKRRSKA